MKFESLHIKNKYLHMELQTVDFSYTGIYLITGPNGSGKSTILKEIVFGNNTPKFPTEDQYNAYNHNRGALISYVPQKVSVPDVTVDEYIRKDNPIVRRDELVNLLDKFGLPELDMGLKIRVMSGGEIVKLSIISALLKKTPYLVLDEPTNNLDDRSTASLMHEIEKYAEDRTVLLVSHDPRVIKHDAYQVFITQDGISQEYSKGIQNTTAPAQQPKISGLKLATRLLKKNHNIVCLAAFVCVLVAALLFNLNEFSRKYSTDIPPKQNSILVYNADFTYPNLNEYYVKSARLEIDRSKYERRLSYDDIPQCAQENGINMFYVLREDKTSAFCDNAFSESAEDPEPASIPSVIAENYLSQCGLSDVFSLKKGRYPADNTHEIALCEKRLSEQFRIENSETSAIGEKLEVDGIKYTIVGITSFDVIWVSYHGNENSLFYCYDVTDYDSFADNAISYQIGADYTYCYEPSVAVITTKPQQEKSVLNSMMSNYPANNYYSYEYNQGWTLAYNWAFLRYILILSVVFASLGSLIIIMLNKAAFADDIVYLEDYRCYYILNRKIRSTYRVSRVIVKLTVIVTLCIADYFLSGAYRVNAFIIAGIGGVMLLADYLYARITQQKLSQ
ncbi:MAG: ATP-binding cassette domain-containing protein [Clostridiales bacterium]|nr:ATP-binding cassette domain-containing protein [Candidatus Cacconaster stercorequi]